MQSRSSHTLLCVQLLWRPCETPMVGPAPEWLIQWVWKGPACLTTSQVMPLLLV